MNGGTIRLINSEEDVIEGDLEPVFVHVSKASVASTLVDKLLFQSGFGPALSVTVKAVGNNTFLWLRDGQSDWK
uniref:Uncharacterized protein n=1 Tax=Cannabis sativa TaxID=3483 RepID=A0A803PUL6_CANSA